MWAAWIADGRETTAEIRGAEDDDVRRKQRQDLGLRRLRGGRTHPLKPYREEEATRGREPPTSPTPRAPWAGHTAARAHLLHGHTRATRLLTETTGIRLQARDMSGMSYIEIVKWENEYRSEEQITMARTEIFSSYDMLHQNSKTLKQRSTRPTPRQKKRNQN